MPPIPRTRVAPCVLGLFVALAGCRNLDLPDVADGGSPPVLRVAVPAANALVPLLTLVSIESSSVAGISSVVVSCGGQALAGWSQPPFSGLVDLGPCQASASPSDAGSGFLGAVLHVVSVSGAGSASSVDVPILLDTRAAVLRVDFPASATPGAPYEVRVTPDRALSAVPVVVFDGRTADRTLLATDGGVLPTYLAQFDQSPGLGTDGYTGGDPVPIELLTQTERNALLTVEAKSQQNGNLTHLKLSVLLSRVAWDRPSPGRLALLAATPVATPAGVQVPLATSDLVPDAGSSWLPGLLQASDGVFVPFNPGLLPGGLDGGYVALGINGAGATLFGSAGSGLWFPPVATFAPGAVALPPAIVRPLVRVQDQLCGPDVFSPPGGACPGANATQTVTCVSPSRPPSTTSGNGGAVSIGRPTPGATLASGVSYLAPAADAACGTLWTFGALGGQLGFAAARAADPSRNTCTLDSARQVLSVGDGTFIVAFNATCSGAPDFPIARVDGTGQLRGGYVKARAALAPVPVQPVAALLDGTLVTARNAPPYTVFERWAEEGPAPLDTARIAGLYATVPGQFPVVPANAVTDTGGSLSVLLSGGPNGTAVAHFGPGLTARWLYLYPRTLVPAQDAPALVGEPSSGDAYLLDPRNQRVLVLRTGRSSPSDGGTAQLGPITSVKSGDGLLTAQFHPGPPPAGTAPTIQVTQTGVAIPGGSTLVSVSASEPITRVIVTVQGVDGYFDLTGLSPAQVQNILLGLGQSAPATFSAGFAGGSASGLGPLQLIPFTVTTVGTGDVQVNVSWDVNSDVDLHVLDPTGAEIYYGASSSPSGGQLDLDSNAGCSIDGRRAENITWPTGSAPGGQYSVLVDYWSACGQTKTSYAVTVNLKGKPSQTFVGTFADLGDSGDRCFPAAGSDAGTVACGRLITTFTYP